MQNRLDTVAEEPLLTLFQQDGVDDAPETRRLQLVAYRDEGGAVLELIASSGDEENLQDRVALLGETTDATSAEREISLRLLRHVASSIRHQQYHDTDIVTGHVKAPDPHA